jgi:hypothetical protein
MGPPPSRGRQTKCSPQHGQTLPPRTAHHVHQLFDLAPLIRLVAAGDRVLDAMRHVITQNFLFDAPQRRLRSADLRHDINAIPIVFDHAREPAHLAFDAAEPLEGGSLAVFTHVLYIPPQGITRKM